MMKPMTMKMQATHKRAGLPLRAVPRPRRGTLNTTASAVNWKVEIYTHTPYDVNANSNVKISLLSKDSGRECPPVSVNPWGIDSWELQNELLLGRIRTGNINLEGNFGALGGIVLTKDKADVGGGSYISYVKLTRSSEELVIPCHSWVWADGKQRVFFLGATLPQDTPAGLKEWRAKDLEALRGKPGDTSARKEGDRIFDYDVYNDLGTPGTADRPNLGSKTYPFPRRLRTGRPKTTEGCELPPSKGSDWWLPPDAKFSFTKEQGFDRGSFLAAIPAFTSIVKGKLGIKKNFESFKEVFSLLDTEGKGLKSVMPQTLEFDYEDKARPGIDLGAILKFSPGESKVVDVVLNQVTNTFKGKSQLLGSVTEGLAWSGLANFLQKTSEKQLQAHKNFGVLFKGVDDITDIINFKVPKVLQDRSDAWHTDEEFGRQAFAGVDPVLVKVCKGLPAGSAIKQEHVEGLLEGKTLTDLFAETTPRLFLLDFFPVLEDYQVLTEKLPASGCLHAGRALLFRRSDGAVVPVAIELKARSAGSINVYTPKDAGQVWMLAKQMINNSDAVVHQGYSHYLRCHAATEPYIIATYRQLSTLHPVHQLLRPHFRYTLNINQNARRNLISAGGVIESSFTPGPVTMELVSRVYGAVWRFDTEGLPNDLKARGFMDDNGNLLVNDYPYAEDGLLYWNAMSTWFTEYLSLYYKSDADIVADAELIAWWDEIKTKGHPDKTVGWPELKTVSDLVNIVSTIAWITSAHHAAVNFMQYDFTSFCLNKPCFISKPMPPRDSPEFKKLAESKGKDFEKLFLSYMPSPEKAASVALIVKLLSTHSLDEEYISETTHDWIKSGPALAAFNRFVANIKNLEDTIKERNNDPSKVTRNTDKGGMPYDVLLPDSPEPGVTARGVPYSVSI